MRYRRNTRAAPATLPHLLASTRGLVFLLQNRRRWRRRRRRKRNVKGGRDGEIGPRFRPSQPPRRRVIGSRRLLRRVESSKPVPAPPDPVPNLGRPSPPWPLSHPTIAPLPRHATDFPDRVRLARFPFLGACFLNRGVRVSVFGAEEDVSTHDCGDSFENRF